MSGAETPMTRLKTYVYIDGFNLDYGRLKGTRSKWLDVSKLMAALLPAYDIQHIRYFTATISPRASDPTAHLRQRTYLAALTSLPNLTLHLGTFLRTTPTMMVHQPKPGMPACIRVIKTEEKGSDVALGSYLVADGCFGRYEAAVVVSNDSDLVPPIEIVRAELGLPVGVLNPRDRPSVQLRQAASFFRPVRAGVVAASQFPDDVRLPDGSQISRPLDWR